MKNIKLNLSALAFILFILSCNKTENHVHGTTTEKHAQKTENHADGEQKTAEVIELNNGEKWTVNTEMKPYIEKSEKILTEFVSKNKTDYKKLAQNISTKNDELIKSCTMDGKSHEELHKWLAPHLELVEELRKENNAEKEKELVHKLVDSYKIYHQYFQ